MFQIWCNFSFEFVFTAVNNTKSNESRRKIIPYYMAISFYYLAYRDKIQNLEGNIFEKKFTTKKLWDGRPVFSK